MMRFLFVAALLSTVSHPMLAQGRGRNIDGIPPGQRPPAGMCRIWIEGVPPGRQPAPTDCRTAIRNRPANGRVIYGDDVRYSSDDRYGKNNTKGKWKDRARNDDYDRDRNDDRYDRRDRDGRNDLCLDRNHDGRCDEGYATNRKGATLPTMVRNILIDRGVRSDDQRRWLGSADVSGHYADADRNGVPERITWLDTANRVVQVWLDDNRDGRADVVRMYQRGQLVRVVQR